MAFITENFLVEVLKLFEQRYNGLYIWKETDASANVKGGVKVGEGLGMDGGAIKVNAGTGLGFDTNGDLKVTLSGGSGSYELPSASESVLGGIRPGTGVSMRGSYLDLTPADTNNLGGVKIGDGLTMDGGNRLSVVQGATIPSATKETTGGIKVGSGLEMVDGFLRVTLTGGNASGVTAATKDSAGVIIPGNGLTMSADVYLDVKPATENSIGGIKVGNGLQMDATTDKLNITPATNNIIGGVIVGEGLHVDGNGLLTCTATGSGTTYSAFTGAQSYQAGTTGLVPAPQRGDQGKFLRGDGSWVTISQSSSVLAASNPSVNGALWQDVIEGVPCLKFRYGDYEYNFFGTGKLIGADAPPPGTSESGTPVYQLSQAISASDGGFWYELRADKTPTLKLRYGSYEFDFEFDSVTYKGARQTNSEYLVSYVPCNAFALPATSSVGTFQDWVVTERSGKATLTGSNIFVADTSYAPLYQTGTATAELSAQPLYGNAFTAKPGIVTAPFTMSYDASVLPIVVNKTTLNEYTTDCWFYFNDGAIDYITKNPNLALNISPRVAIKKGTYNGLSTVVLNLTLNNSKFVFNGTTYPANVVRLASEYANRKNHLAITCKIIDGQIVSSLALNGKFILKQTGQYKVFPLGSQYTVSCYAAFNKIRWFNKVFWDYDFTPPKETDYI